MPAVTTSLPSAPPTDLLDDRALHDLAARFEDAASEEVVAWAVATFGPRLVLTASMADAVLIDLATKVDPGIEVAFIDTRYHFPETLETAARVRRRYQLNLTVLRTTAEPDGLWARDPDACCAARKVRPLDELLAGKDAWMSGLRREDHTTRADVPIVARDRRGLVKVNPLAPWTDDDVDSYIAANDIIVNPLLSDGYGSVGCWPCTQRVADGEHARSGRWAESGKTECGLHL